MKPVSALALMALFAPQALLAEDAKKFPIPPPPPSLFGYHPNPGPFVVFIDDAGALDAEQMGTIKRTEAAWTGGTLDAFLICFRAGSGQKKYPSKRAEDSIASALKQAGAKAVLFDGGAICDKLPATFGTPERSRFEIRGVIRR